MKPTIQYPDFEKLDLRVGKVIAATAPEWSNKLIQQTVDFGSEIGEKTILSGIRKWYAPEDLIGKNFPYIVNLAERKMGESISQGMMMMVVSEADGETKVTLIPVDESVAPGTTLG